MRRPPPSPAQLLGAADTSGMRTRTEFGAPRLVGSWWRGWPSQSPARFLPALQLSGLLASVVLGFSLIASEVHAHYPIQEWLFWRYAVAAALAIIWTVACCGVGCRLLTLLRPTSLRPTETAVAAFGLGALAFAVTLFLLGLVGGFGPVCFVGVPATFLAVGGRPLIDWTRRLRRHLSPRLPALFSKLRVRDLAALFAGFVGLLFSYAMVLHPGNVHFDSRWYHLALAEHYVAASGIEATREGSFLSAYPQLATLLYTWAFQLPGSTEFDRVMLCAHVEFIAFVATLAMVPILVRRVLGRRAPLAWVATFLFPGVFLYGTGLHVNAERFAALFDALGCFALFVAWRHYTVKTVALVAVLFGAALLTKYAALSVAVLPILGIVVRGLWLAVRSEHEGRRRALAALACAAATGLVVTSPHWLKNWFWYGDPFYPLLHRHLSVQPFTADAVAPFENWFYSPEFRPARTWDGVLETLKALATFAFVPHNFGVHGRVPVFGFLFTAATLCLPFVRAPRRVWALFGVCYGALFVWYWLHHFDRYLQIILPCMVASTLSVLLLTWRTHALARVGVVALVGLQVVWGGDVPFIPSHSMLRTSVPSAVSDFIASGYRGNREDRLSPFGNYSKIGRMLPPEAVTLVHENLQSLGIRSQRISDAPGTQGAISYGRLERSRDVHELLRGLGVTHVVADWKTSSGHASLASDFMFHDWVRHTTNPRVFGASTLSEIPAEAPEDSLSNDALVLVLGCKQQSYAPGVHELRQLNRSPHEKAAAFPTPKRPLGLALADYVASADIDLAVTFEGCATPRKLRAQGFRELVRRKHETLWMR